ncbi:hypothetical protein K432DRAFT_71681 [Lepidopterella palustris CBS 459.81]|uniref:Uncharacterized protein n=1 Tax=Lepidopterella palustris CBS 459.81 TaxID=1314670 RepID=A0A8E2E8G9_9PEZI|nr:hypothetical protein K432DRAFT_71681 [Lepidopterella palustris CBS 459.81]
MLPKLALVIDVNSLPGSYVVTCVKLLTGLGVHHKTPLALTFSLLFSSHHQLIQASNTRHTSFPHFRGSPIDRNTEQHSPHQLLHIFHFKIIMHAIQIAAVMGFAFACFVSADCPAAATVVVTCTVTAAPDWCTSSTPIISASVGTPTSILCTSESAPPETPSPFHPQLMSGGLSGVLSSSPPETPLSSGTSVGVTETTSSSTPATYTPSSHTTTGLHSTPASLTLPPSTETGAAGHIEFNPTIVGLVAAGAVVNGAFAFLI